MRKILLAVFNLILSIFILSIFIIKTSAASEIAEINLSTADKLIDGGAVTISMNIENINATKGINNIKGKLTFDKEVFETYSIETSNSWNKENSSDMLSLNKSIAVVGNEEVAKIKLNAKKDLTLTNTTIKLSDITVAGERVSSKSEGTTITVYKNSDAQIIKTGDKSKSIETAKSSGITDEAKLPDAGENKKIGLIVIISMAIMISLIILILYERI